MKKFFRILLYSILVYLLVALVMNLLRFDKPDFSKVLVPNSSFGNKEQGNGEKKLLKAGESFTVSRGVYHKFFNETDKEVIASAEVSEGFAFMLTQYMVLQMIILKFLHLQNSYSNYLLGEVILIRI